MSRKILLHSVVLLLAFVGLGWWAADGLLSSTQFNPHQTKLFERHNVTTPVAQTELRQAMDYCGLTLKDGIELPVLFADGHCYVGQTAVDTYLNPRP